MTQMLTPKKRHLFFLGGRKTIQTDCNIHFSTIILVSAWALHGNRANIADMSLLPKYMYERKMHRHMRVYQYVHFISIDTAFNQASTLGAFITLESLVRLDLETKIYLCFRKNAYPLRSPQQLFFLLHYKNLSVVCTVCTSMFSSGLKLASCLNLLFSLSKTTIPQKFHILLLATLRDIYSAYQNESFTFYGNELLEQCSQLLVYLLQLR